MKEAIETWGCHSNIETKKTLNFYSYPFPITINSKDKK